MNKNLEARGFLKNDFIVEEFIDGEIFTLSYFVNDFWEYFLFPIVKVKSVQDLWIDDFSNYVRIIYKWLDLELDEEKLDIFIKKHIKIFWIKNTFVFHDMKKTNSWEFKTIEVNGRIGWYRLEMYKETFGVNMLSFIDKVGHLNIKENIFFDNEKYLKIEKQKILERKKLFPGKLYIEVGGKLLEDNHASRVLPGFRKDNKIRIFETLKDGNILSNKEISEITGFKKDKNLKLLKSLVEKKYIVTIGNGRGTKYYKN